MTAVAARKITILRVRDVAPGHFWYDTDKKRVDVHDPLAWRILRILASNAGAAMHWYDVAVLAHCNVDVALPMFEDAVRNLNESARIQLRCGNSWLLVRRAGPKHYYLDENHDQVEYEPIPWDGTDLRQAREILGLNQSQMGAALDLTQTTISTKENDHSTMALDARDRLAVEALLRRAGKWPLPADRRKS